MAARPADRHRGAGDQGPSVSGGRRARTSRGASTTRSTATRATPTTTRTTPTSRPPSSTTRRRPLRRQSGARRPAHPLGASPRGSGTPSASRLAEPRTRPGSARPRPLERLRHAVWDRRVGRELGYARRAQARIGLGRCGHLDRHRPPRRRPGVLARSARRSRAARRPSCRSPRSRSPGRRRGIDGAGAVLRRAARGRRHLRGRRRLRVGDRSRETLPTNTRTRPIESAPEASGRSAPEPAGSANRRSSRWTGDPRSARRLLVADAEVASARRDGFGGHGAEIATMSDARRAQLRAGGHERGRDGELARVERVAARETRDEQLVVGRVGRGGRSRVRHVRHRTPLATEEFHVAGQELAQRHASPMDAGLHGADATRRSSRRSRRSRSPPRRRG